MNISPNHMIALAVIQREGNLSRAAAALNSSQPALSRMVSDLEVRLGSQLFDRTVRPWRLTRLGDELAQQGQTIETAQTRAERFVTEFRSGIGGVVHIAGPPFFIDTQVAPMIARFHGHHANIRVDQAYGYPAEVTRRVQNGDIDIAICPLDPIEDTGGLSFTDVMPARNVIAARWDHPLLTEKFRVQAEDLTEFYWISPPENSPLRQDLQTSLAAAGLHNIRIAYSGPGLAGVVNHLKHSDCLAVLPHGVVFEMRHQREIRALPFALTAPPRSVGLLTKKSAAQVPVVDLLRRHLISEFDVIRDLIRRHESKVLWGNSTKKS